MQCCPLGFSRLFYCVSPYVVDWVQPAAWSLGFATIVRAYMRKHRMLKALLLVTPIFFS